MNNTARTTQSEINRFEAFFTYASLGIVIVNHKGEIIAANPFSLQLFGYSEQEIHNQKIDLLIPKRFHQKHESHHKTYMQNPKSRPMGVGMDLFAVRKDGTEFPVEVSLGNYDYNGEKNVIAFISDISIRKKAELEIEKLNNELEDTVEKRTRELTDAMHQLEQSKEELAKSLIKEKELGELKSRFVSMASHEFRTPLSTVLSSAYLIQKYTGAAEDQARREKHLQRVISSVNMLTDILNDFLSVGKIEEGKIQVRPAEFNLQEHVNAVADEIKNNLKQKQQITYHHKGNTTVLMDASLLKHILLNLLTNASKFSPETSTIEISTVCSNTITTLAVRDHGIGISKDDQLHLMERFFRGTNAGNIQGTGLGLHIVSKYAELMNGTVECKSELEKGTEFVITFNNKADY
jgi:PAS domain S-box-containing protein